jgi:pilus assembly protein CpaF
VARIEQMVSMIGMDVPVAAIRAQIAAGIHFVVQLNRHSDGARRVTSISEVTGMEGSVISMQDIFLYRRTGRSASGEVLGEFVATGIRPRCADLLLQSGVELPEGLFLASRPKS